MPDKQPDKFTLMFYLAADNALAPGIVSQLKTIKNAGFFPGANVIVQFDPRTVGTPTHIFDVNVLNKLKHPRGNIGFQRGDDPFVRNLLEDKLWSDEKDRFGNDIRDQLKAILSKAKPDARKKTQTKVKYDPPFPPDSDDKLSVADSLGGFLTFCAENYPAEHYMLFILGHGVVVANDIFLFDEHAAEHSLSLSQLGSLLVNFKHKIRGHSGKFELISLHSCSVSSVEVAYELQGTAQYMLASQGPAFVGSWPYRSILIRIFKHIQEVTNKPEKDPDKLNEQIKEMIKKIFFYCLYNSADFMLAGYSFSLTLCNLTRVSKMTEALRRLSIALAGGVTDTKLRKAILLAHWKSQSYWEERYTDIADFCFCLMRELTKETESSETMHEICLMRELKKETESSETMHEIICACKDVLRVMDKEFGTFSTVTTAVLQECENENNKEISDHVILLAEFAGPAYQYSNGLSVFFPWSQPVTDTPILEEYRNYKFNRATSWLTFLEMYWRTTMRQTHKTEMQSTPTQPSTTGHNQLKVLFEDIASLMFNPQGTLSTTAELRKTDPTDPTGDDDGTCSIKNFPFDTRAQGERWNQAAPDGLPIGDEFLLDFFKENKYQE